MSKSQSRGQTQATASKVAHPPKTPVLGGSPGRTTRNSAKSQQAADFEKETQEVANPPAAAPGPENAATGDDTTVPPALSGVQPDLTPIHQASSGVETNEETAVVENIKLNHPKRHRAERPAGTYLDEFRRRR